ncbi:hypothetical protein cypCar_00039433 [Cyprinus carpio]|nr:hypothetical protein cypCar_00039433 [Cyprinus carpio]
MGISDIMSLDVTSVWLVLSVVAVAAGVFYLYSLILRHLAKTTVRNKVVLITDSLSTLGNGAALSEQLDHCCQCSTFANL